MITYEQIKEANSGISTLDVKGKDYAQVNQRVIAFKKVYPEGFIHTSLMSNDGGVCVIKASCGYYAENGDMVILATGIAYERESSSYINKTSYIENCETSAVGRALGFAGFGIDTSICSAEEVKNAIEQQSRKEPTFTPATPNGSEPEANPAPNEMSRVEMLETVVKLYTPDQRQKLAERYKVESYEYMSDDQLAALMEKMRKAGKIK